MQLYAAAAWITLAQVTEAAAANEALIKQKMATAPSEVAQQPFRHAIHATCALLCLLAAGAWVPLFLANCSGCGARLLCMLLCQLRGC